MLKKMKISPEGLLKKFLPKTSDFGLLKAELTTPNISDALKHLTGEVRVMSRIKPITDAKTIGRAVTVKTAADDWGTSVMAIDIASRGDVLVICSEGDNKALWGELTSKTAKEKGIAGTIVDGAVRDVAGIKKLGYPVFSKSVVPNAGDPKAEGKINIPINCGGVVVNPQDVVVGDDCGVVVVPKEHFREVIRTAFEIKSMENGIIRKIEDGLPLSEILDIK